ncbi:hypothetical protein I310_01752 [Cryptococcus deuterogattii CA1014]|nr:hypothetical protein I310_01752 [Cryptococcus deuterogattii CA1014]
MSHLRPVTISYSALTFGGKKEDLQQQVFHALGTHKGALGIALISGKYNLPPQFLYLREKLFRLAHRLANMPEKERAKLEKPETSHMFGWSHGKEMMKGYKRGHITPIHSWITQLSPMRLGWHTRNTMPETFGQKGMSGLEDFEQAFKELGKLIFDVGVLLASVCDNFAFQTGEALSLLTSHRLSATPHFVSGRSPSATLLSRETLPSSFNQT